MAAGDVQVLGRPRFEAPTRRVESWPLPAPAFAQEQALDTSAQALKQASRRLQKAMAQSKSNHVLYVFLFAFAMILMVYFWSKVYRLLTWIF